MDWAIISHQGAQLLWVRGALRTYHRPAVGVKKHTKQTNRKHCPYYHRTLHKDNAKLGVPIVAQQKLAQPVFMKIRVRSLASPSGLRSGIALSCGVGRRRGLDPVLLWLWCRPVAVALIWPLAWELSYAIGVALKTNKKKKIERKNKK